MLEASLKTVRHFGHSICNDAVRQRSSLHPSSAFRRDACARAYPHCGAPIPVWISSLRTGEAPAGQSRSQLNSRPESWSRPFVNVRHSSTSACGMRRAPSCFFCTPTRSCQRDGVRGSERPSNANGGWWEVHSDAALMTRRRFCGAAVPLQTGAALPWVCFWAIRQFSFARGAFQVMGGFPSTTARISIFRSGLRVWGVPVCWGRRWSRPLADTVSGVRSGRSARTFGRPAGFCAPGPPRLGELSPLQMLKGILAGANH